MKTGSKFGPNLIFALFIICGTLSAGPRQCDFTVARLKYGGGGDWYANPSSLPNLLLAVKKRTQIPICDTLATVEISSEDLFHYPFIYMTGHGDVHFTNREKLRLRRYLIGGGFLWADDNYGLDRSFRQEIASLFPENPLTKYPQVTPYTAAFINSRVCRKYMNMTESRLRVMEYFLREEWLFFTLSVLISVTGWKTCRYIMTARSFTSLLCEWA